MGQSKEEFRQIREQEVNVPRLSMADELFLNDLYLNAERPHIAVINNPKTNVKKQSNNNE